MDCYWIKDRKPDGDPVWQTTCGHMHEFIDGGPVDNGYRFCPYCGGKLAGSVGRVLGMPLFVDPSMPDDAIRIEYGPHRRQSTTD